MFRIHFDTGTALFVVQVLQYSMFWRTVQRKISGAGTSISEPLSFQTYEAARHWVEGVGLVDLYDEQHPKSYRQFILNGGVR